MATIKDIAKLAEVSPTTVSRVLSQDETMVVSCDVYFFGMRTEKDIFDAV